MCNTALFDASGRPGFRRTLDRPRLLRPSSMRAGFWRIGRAVAGAVIACSITGAAQAQDGPPFRDAVQAGNLLFLSGQVGQSPAGLDPHGDGFDVAARIVMDKLGVVLARHGADFDSVVKCTVMLADIQDWPRFNVVYRRYFKPSHLPARSAMGGLSLVRGGQVEVECIAHIPAASDASASAPGR